jgi:hypothetical protein
MTRLVLLSHDEITELYTIPKLEDEDRALLFSLSELEARCLEHISVSVTIAQKVNLILQIGYFKASRNLFKVSFRTSRDDVWFIMKRYFPQEPFPKKG